MTGLPAPGVLTWNDAPRTEPRQVQPVREPLRFSGGPVRTCSQVITTRNGEEHRSSSKRHWKFVLTTEAVGASWFVGDGLVGRPE